MGGGQHRASLGQLAWNVEEQQGKHGNAHDCVAGLVLHGGDIKAQARKMRRVDQPSLQCQDCGMTTTNMELGETDHPMAPYAQAQPPGSYRDTVNHLRRHVPLPDAMMGARPEPHETGIRSTMAFLVLGLEI